MLYSKLWPWANHDSNSSMIHTGNTKSGIPVYEYTTNNGSHWEIAVAMDKFPSRSLIMAHIIDRAKGVYISRYTSGEWCKLP